MTSEEVVVIVPMKPLASAKSRLRSVLDPEERMALTCNMLRIALDSVRGSGVREARVVGGDPSVRGVARAAGAIWMADEGADLNDTMERAFRDVFAAKGRPIYLPADLPFLRPDDLRQFIAEAESRIGLVLAPDRWGTGTNGILLAGPSPFRPALGVGSFQRHIAQAASLGLQAAVCRNEGLARDLDTPEDLALYEAESPGLTARLTGRSPERADLSPSGRW